MHTFWISTQLDVIYSKQTKATSFKSLTLFSQMSARFPFFLPLRNPKLFSPSFWEKKKKHKQNHKQTLSLSARMTNKRETDQWNLKSQSSWRTLNFTRQQIRDLHEWGWTHHIIVFLLKWSRSQPLQPKQEGNKMRKGCVPAEINEMITSMSLLHHRVPTSNEFFNQSWFLIKATNSFIDHY